jgi:hypothetical protein
VSGSEADVEGADGKGVGSSARRRNKRKKKMAEGKFLSKPVKDLNAKQKKTHKELQVNKPFYFLTYELQVNFKSDMHNF